MQKKTRLDDSADIYKQRVEKSEKEKLKEMDFKGKLAYLWEYYRIHALIIIAVVALTAYIIKIIVTPDIKPEFNAVIINNIIDPTTLEQYEDSFAEWLQLDPAQHKVVLNANLYTGQMDYTSSQALGAFIAASQIDVIIAPESDFSEYVKRGYFKKLFDALSTDVYSSLTDYFYMQQTNDDSEKSPYGIYLDSTKLFKDIKYGSDSYILGVVANCPHPDNTVEFIKYLFEKE